MGLAKRDPKPSLEEMFEIMEEERAKRRTLEYWTAAMKQKGFSFVQKLSRDVEGPSLPKTEVWLVSEELFSEKRVLKWFRDWEGLMSESACLAMIQTVSPGGLHFPILYNRHSESGGLELDYFIGHPFRPSSCSSFQSQLFQIIQVEYLYCNSYFFLLLVILKGAASPAWNWLGSSRFERGEHFGKRGRRSSNYRL